VRSCPAANLASAADWPSSGMKTNPPMARLVISRADVRGWSTNHAAGKFCQQRARSYSADPVESSSRCRGVALVQNMSCARACIRSGAVPALVGDTVACRRVPSPVSLRGRNRPNADQVQGERGLWSADGKIAFNGRDGRLWGLGVGLAVWRGQTISGAFPSSAKTGA